MATLRDRAIDIVRKMPDDKILYVFQVLENIDLMILPAKETVENKAESAYNRLQSYRKSAKNDRNYKEELHSALEEKYAGSD